MSSFFQTVVKLNATGSAAVGIKAAKLQGLPIPFPSFDEQRLIVRIVETLIKFTSAVEKRVDAATARAEKLTQVILAKAFQGELVPRESELARTEGRAYESASDLLARIRAERSVSAEQDHMHRKNGKRQSHSTQG